MEIRGIRREDLARFHQHLGRGKGGVIGYRHLPSGIAVFRRCPADVPLVGAARELLAELEEKLRERGLIA